MADKKITIKLIKSGIGRIKSHKQCIKGLGFRKLNQVIEVEDTPSVRGMINKIRDMVVEISPAGDISTTISLILFIMPLTLGVSSTSIT